MDIEREKELFSQIEELRSRLEREYEQSRDLNVYLNKQIARVHEDIRKEQDKPENNWNWLNIECSQSELNAYQDIWDWFDRQH